MTQTSQRVVHLVYLPRVVIKHQYFCQENNSIKDIQPLCCQNQSSNTMKRALAVVPMTTIVAVVVTLSGARSATGEHIVFNYNKVNLL